MRKFWLPILALAALLTWQAPALAGAFESDSLKFYNTEGTFEDVKQDVLDAVTNKGFVVDYTAHLGSMLNRTAKDVGAARNVYGNAQLLQFCSAVFSREAIEADPKNIVFCPYVIVVYTLDGAPDTVYVGYRKPDLVGNLASRSALLKIEKLLDDIVRDALDL